MIIHGVSSMNGFMTNCDDRFEGRFALETSVIFDAKFPRDPQVSTSEAGVKHIWMFVKLQHIQSFATLYALIKNISLRIQ